MKKNVEKTSLIGLKDVIIRFSQTKTNKRGDIIMAQGVLNFKYEEEKKDFGTTSTAGLLLFLDLLYKMDFIKMVNRHLDAKMNKQGWNDFYFLLSLMLLNICGGDCVDDIKIMEKDDGLCRVMKNLELRNTWGRHRQKLKRQWRNGKEKRLPVTLCDISLFAFVSQCLRGKES